MHPIVKSAPLVYRALNGIINVYKPAGIKVSNVRAAITANLCKDLNALQGRESRKKVVVEACGADHLKYSIREEEDLSDHLLTVGPRYQLEDIKCCPAASLGIKTSGVLRLNAGSRATSCLHKNRPLRVYHINCQLGSATEENFTDSRTIARATYSHVHIDKVSSLLASMQASHQKKMFDLCGVDLQTQAAYDLAAGGTVRPTSSKVPIIYGIRCVSFRRPELIIEVHALNESEHYFRELIYQIGIELKTFAHCTTIQCIRHGPFFVSDSLLRRHWTLSQALISMRQCERVLNDNRTLASRQSSSLVRIE